MCKGYYATQLITVFVENCRKLMSCYLLKELRESGSW